MDYRVNLDGKLKTVHANLLKKYVHVWAVSVIDCDGEDTDDNQKSIVLPPATQTSIYSNKILEQITPVQRETVNTMCESFSDVLTDLSATTTLEERNIELTTIKPLQVF